MKQQVRKVVNLLRVILYLPFTAIKLGKRVVLGKGVRLKATDGGCVLLEDDVVVERFVDLHAKYGNLTIGRNSYIGPWSIIRAREDITIGSDCLISEYVVIRDQNHKYSMKALTRNSGFSTAPINISNNVWIGAKATIMPGVCIGENSVIGANAVVTENVPPNVVVGGVPARVIKELVTSA